MALLDISDVTRSIVTLIREAFFVSPAWTLPVPDVLPEPPIRLTGDGVGFYLYHVQEKKEYSNFPVPGGNQPPVRFLPTALTLYYQLSANNTLPGTGAYAEQLMMSVAIKALHDYPVIDDSTQINGVTIFPIEIRGRDNRFKIVHQPIPYGEAVHNWTAGTSSIKLSAYYEISVVFLEPEETTSYSGRVLTYGNYIFAGGAPSIVGSQNIIDFKLPNELITRQIKVQPAQAVPGKTIDFFGSGFIGDKLNLRLINPRWTESVVADSSWNLTLSAANKITATVRSTAIFEKNNLPVDVLPGVYSAQVIVTKILELPGNATKTFKKTSNQFPFIISPDVTVGVIAGTIATINGFIFQHPDLSPDDIDIYFGETRLERNTGGPFNTGQFKINTPGTLDINMPGTLTSGQLFPLRVVIGGAESPPAWIKIP